MVGEGLAPPANPYKLPSAHELYSICRQTDVRSNFPLTPHPPQAVPLPPLGKANCTFILSSYRTLCARTPFPHGRGGACSSRKSRTKSRPCTCLIFHGRVRALCATQTVSSSRKSRTTLRLRTNSIPFADRQMLDRIFH